MSIHPELFLPNGRIAYGQVIVQMARIEDRMAELAEEYEQWRAQLELLCPAVHQAPARIDHSVRLDC